MNIKLNSLKSDPKVKLHTFGLGTCIVFLLFGVVFTGVGYMASKSFEIDQSWMQTTGEVIDTTSRLSDGQTTYRPIVQYDVSGQQYTITGSIGGSSRPSLGDMREVGYNPQQPAQAKLVEGAESKIFSLLFPLIGIVSIILSIYFFIKSRSRSRKIKTILQAGQKVQGVLLSINSNSSQNGHKIYKIKVAAPDLNGVVQNYTSDSITGADGIDMMDLRENPIPIDVYIDRANSENYYVDITMLPKMTPDQIKELLKDAIRKQQNGAANDEKPSQTPPFVG